jgi:hypothetical protein
MAIVLRSAPSLTIRVGVRCCYRGSRGPNFKLVKALKLYRLDVVPLVISWDALIGRVHVSLNGGPRYRPGDEF